MIALDSRDSEDSVVIETQIIKGIVKWFNPVQGFGFVTSEDLAGDILLHANVLRSFGKSSISDGISITAKVQKTERGFQAIELLEADFPTEIIQCMPKEKDVANTATPILLDMADVCPARVKWFDKAKGFGFANMFGKTEDVFIHIEILHRAGLSELQPGEAICLLATKTPRGYTATHLFPWGAVITK